MKRTTLDRCSFASLLLLAGVILLPTGGALAVPNGISGFSGATGSDCRACHSAGAAVPSLSLSADSGSPTVVTDSVSSYTLLMAGGPAVTAGLDVAGSGGTLIDTNSTGTRISSGELVQSFSNPVSGGVITWTFDWVAPSIEGVYTLYAAALSADGSGGLGGDGTQTTTLMVEVPEPSALLSAAAAFVVLAALRRREGQPSRESGP